MFNLWLLIEIFIDIAYLSRCPLHIKNSKGLYSNYFSAFLQILYQRQDIKVVLINDPVKDKRYGHMEIKKKKLVVGCFSGQTVSFVVCLPSWELV